MPRFLICLICLNLTSVIAQDLYTGTEDLYDYLLIKSNIAKGEEETAANFSFKALSEKYQQHLAKFPASPFRKALDLLRYDKNVRAFFSKNKSLNPTQVVASSNHLAAKWSNKKPLANKNSSPHHRQKKWLKKNVLQLSAGLGQTPTSMLAKYASWKKFFIKDLDILEDLLFAHVAIYSRNKDLIRPYRRYLKLYKQKMGKNWQTRYVEHLNRLGDPQGDLAWYTYKVSEFHVAYSLYSNAVYHSKKKEALHWFYLGLSLFHLSKYQSAQLALKRFLREANKKKQNKTQLQQAYYHYYLCFDKMRRGKNKLKELHNYCRKNPSEKMYRLLLRMAARHQYPHYEAIRQAFFKRYPHSYTAYLKRRESAFDLLNQGDEKGLKLLGQAYGELRQKVYQEIIHWQFAKAPQDKENYFAKGDNWFTDYFYQNSRARPAKKLWQQWMASLTANSPVLNDKFIGSHKVFYWKNEKEKWQWFEKTARGYGSNTLAKSWTAYTNRIYTFTRFGYAGLMEKEIKKHFSKPGPERLFYLRALYEYSSNTYKLVILYERALTAYGGRQGGIPHAVYRYAYPLYRYKQVKALSKRYRIPAALIYSVIRAESFYKEDAVSFAGAIGLMQIMPATGKWVYERSKMSKSYKFDLFSPEINLEIGVRFLSDLYRQFDGNVVLAAAAYNAGGSRVKRWTKNKKINDWVRFSHFIPYDQTERYVRKVIRNLQAYRTLYPSL